MKTSEIARSPGFEVLFSTPRAQAARMVLAPGGKTGGSDNRHEEADQWLYVVSGRGRAVVEGQQHELDPETVLLIERGERHEIRNVGDEPLVTFNVYSPPAYR